MLTRPLRRFSTAIVVVSTTAAMQVLGTVVAVPAASAAQAPVGLGTTVPYAVLAGSTVTNTGFSVLDGDLGLDPGTAVTGFPPGTYTGAENIANGPALQAQNDLTTAYNTAAGATPVTVEPGGVLSGQTLAPGVYKGTSTLSLTGTLTLNGEGSGNSVFIFQAASTLITASSSTVSLINGATWCNVFWQVGSSATLGTSTTFVGTIMALTSATLDTTASVMGRVLARNGAVTLDDNLITEPACTTSTTTATTVPGGGSGGGGASGTNAKGTGTTAGGTPTGNGLGGGLGSGVVPTGFPATGLGGASRSDDPMLVALGGLALIGAGLASVQAVRRRRLLVATHPVAAGDANGDA